MLQDAPLNNTSILTGLKCIPWQIVQQRKPYAPVVAVAHRGRTGSPPPERRHRRDFKSGLFPDQSVSFTELRRLGNGSSGNRPHLWCYGAFDMRFCPAR